MRNPATIALALASLSFACGDTGGRPAPPSGARSSLSILPTPTPSLPGRPVEPLERLESAGRPPLELSASALPGHQPLPTYRARVRNACDRPVRQVVATVVYLDAQGRALAGENHDVAFGSPLKAIDPGVALDTTFLSRVDSASEVRLVVRLVTFLEKGTGAGPLPREWTNPRYEKDLAEAEGRR